MPDSPSVVLRERNVYVDDVNYGLPADAIANNPALAPLVQRALERYFDRCDAAHETALQERAAAHATALLQMQESYAGELAAALQANTACQFDLSCATARADAAEARLASLLAATADLCPSLIECEKKRAAFIASRRTAAEQRRAELQAQQAALAAELATLG